MFPGGKPLWNQYTTLEWRESGYATLPVGVTSYTMAPLRGNGPRDPNTDESITQLSARYWNNLAAIYRYYRCYGSAIDVTVSMSNPGANAVGNNNRAAVGVIADPIAMTKGTGTLTFDNLAYGNFGIFKRAAPSSADGWYVRVKKKMLNGRMFHSQQNVKDMLYPNDKDPVFNAWYWNIVVFRPDPDDTGFAVVYKVEVKLRFFI